MQIDSQYFDNFAPVYDAVPSTWENAEPFIVEQLKKISNVLNTRENGFFLDQELLAGKFFIPGINEITDGSTSQQFRSIFRKVIVFPNLSPGLNSQPHGLTIDANFSLIQLFAAATNAIAFTGEPIPNGSDTINYDSVNINITVANSYTRAFAVIEYMQEL